MLEIGNRVADLAEAVEDESLPAGTSRKEVMPGSSDEAIIAAATIEGIVAVESGQRVGTAIAI